MSNYAIHDGKKVINVIVAESLEIAESITGLNAIETTGEPWIEWTLEEEGWRKPSPYPSWIWSGSEWAAPKLYPNDGNNYFWDEINKNWNLEQE